MTRILIDRVRENWKSALTVSLVSLPLSLALAVASGATPTQGVITAIWAGLFCAILGGSHFNIVGPTGALSGVLVIYSFSHGFQSLSYVAIISGILMFLAFAFRLDKYIIYIPNSVVHGFTLGVAAIIGLNQLDNALGLSGLIKTENVAMNALNSLEHVLSTNIVTFIIFLTGLIFMFLWNKRFAKIPGAVIIAALGIIISILLNNNTIHGFELKTLGQAYPEISPTFFTNIISGFNKNILFEKDLWIVSITTAIVAILETLLSGQIAEQRTKIQFSRRREIFGLSISNIASGIFGGIPATAALARTSLNIKSGASHRTSAILQPIFFVLITFVFIKYFRLLPMAVVASILIYVAINLVERHHFIKLLNNEKTAFITSVIVAVTTVIIDPMIGILVGTVIALLVFASEVSKGKTEILFWKDKKYVDSASSTEIKKKIIVSDIAVYKISGTLTYLNMPAHIETVKHIKGNKFVIISLRHAFYADTDGISYLEELIKILKKSNGGVVLSGINKEIENKLKNEKFYYEKLQANKIYKRSEEAVIALSK